ncbi:MAG: GNAT family N-acetyltransferase [Dehalococcoidia bacterium]|nr:GNAT family N-acetyltransferase [Dehalococcoidia bacterium]
MLPEGLELREFDPQAATDAEFVALNALQNRVLAETRPYYPPATLSETIAAQTHKRSTMRRREWAVWHGAVMIAAAGMEIYVGQTNQHLAEIWISVLPEWRRRTIGTHLLARIADGVQAEDRRLIMASTSSNSPAGGRFLERLGAEAALRASQNQLVVSELDRPRMQVWLQQAESLKVEFELGIWEGRFPEEEIAAIARLHELMNTAPRGDLQIEDQTYSIEEMREWEGSMAAQNQERWTMYVRRRASGELAGYTEVFWSPNHPDVLGQGDTGVAPAYRNRGLGRWLKAAMIEKVIRERPSVQTVRTGNADANAAMLKINHEMGFKLLHTWQHWQVSLGQVESYLAGRS